MELRQHRRLNSHGAVHVLEQFPSTTKLVSHSVHPRTAPTTGIAMERLENELGITDRPRNEITEQHTPHIRPSGTRDIGVTATEKEKDATKWTLN